MSVLRYPVAMKYWLFSVATLLLSACVTSQSNKSFVNRDVLKSSTIVEVVELKNMSFSADSFFEERRNLSSDEVLASEPFVTWTNEAIQRVNDFLDSDAHVPAVKIKLIFAAKITDSKGKERLTPISMIESYQEPLTNSIRIGMKELAHDKESFQLTIAHEYAHLVFEHASRVSGATKSTDSHITFWPKSLYEGIADFMMGISLESMRTAGPNNWSSKQLNQFSSAAEARREKDKTINLARAAFKKMGLIPAFPIYNDWLSVVNKYIESVGGKDPYAEGRWFAGALIKKADSREKQNKIIDLILDDVRRGRAVKEIEEYYNFVVSQL